VPRRYPVEFRRKVLDLIETGRPIAEIAAQLGVSDQTVYNCALRSDRSWAARRRVDE
jgi:transposase-like protein